jgi:hypothetical protein
MMVEFSEMIYIEFGAPVWDVEHLHWNLSDEYNFDFSSLTIVAVLHAA